MADIALTYLARGSHGLATVDRFVAAWRRHPAGCEHDLVFLAKGWTACGRVALAAAAAACGASVLDLPDDGFDWGAYFRAAPRLPHRLLCLVNSFAQPRVDGWLSRLATALSGPRVVMAGATASWETPRRLAPAVHPGPEAWLRRRLGHLRSIPAVMAFPPFPNPHLRSNGVLVARDLFARFAAERAVPATKMQAHALESGRQGLSRFAEPHGQLVVAGADGRAYAPADWPASRTFRVPDAGNLLISDNRTDQFAAAGQRERDALGRAAWGDAYPAC